METKSAVSEGLKTMSETVPGGPTGGLAEGDGTETAFGGESFCVVCGEAGYSCDGAAIDYTGYIGRFQFKLRWLEE